jgi:hypothetical protein
MGYCVNPTEEISCLTATYFFRCELSLLAQDHLGYLIGLVYFYLEFERNYGYVT